jgi:hypothetical protein
MDDLKDWELELLIDNSIWSNKVSWEQTRMVMYSAVLPYMKKGLNKTAKDLLPLPTDDTGYKFKTEHDIEVTDAQLEKLRQHAQHLEQFFKKNNNNKE